MRFCLIFESLDVFSNFSLHLLNCVYLNNIVSLFPGSVSHCTEGGELSNWAVSCLPYRVNSALNVLVFSYSFVCDSQCVFLCAFT